jgi:hypothetical protein
MQLHKIGRACLDQPPDIISLSDPLLPGKIDTIRNDGELYKMQRIDGMPNRNGTYMHIKTNGECPVAQYLSSQIDKMRDELSKLAKEQREQGELIKKQDEELRRVKAKAEEVDELRKERDELKHNKIIRQQDNLLCDFISAMYAKIVAYIRDNYKIDVNSWESLMIYQKQHPDIDIERMILDRVKGMRITEAEWDCIVKFKDKRNKETHRKINTFSAQEARQILSTDDRFKSESKDLVKGLEKIINSCEF